MSDANNCVHFDVEFCIKANFIIEPENKEPKKKKIYFQLYKPSSKKEPLCVWKTAVSCIEDPNSGKLITADSKSKDYGNVTLFFRVSVVPRSNFKHGRPPRHFFSLVSSSTKIADVLKNNEELATEIEELVTESLSVEKTARFNNQESVLQSFYQSKPQNTKTKRKSLQPNSCRPDPKLVPTRGSLDNFFGASKKKPERVVTFVPIKTVEDSQLIKVHQEAIVQLAINQCSPHFVSAIFQCIICPESCSQDFSKNLFDPILKFSILSLPQLNSSHMQYLLEPLYKALDNTLNQSHSAVELFYILATIYNFGILLLNNADIFSTVHNEALDQLSTFITQILMQLTQNLISSIAPSISSDGLDFTDKESMNQIQLETNQFLIYCQNLNIPEQIVQVIVVETCRYFDVLLFNVIIDTAKTFTIEKVTFLLSQVRRLQTIFDCLPCNFHIAFTNLLSFISNTNLLWNGNDEEKLPEKSDLMRSIIERCKPKIVLPPGVELDDIGKKLDSTEELKLELPKFNFQFSYDWLFSQTEANKWN
ncbi:erythrocyte binding protein [Histomonas meleagridis]|uniref:erythrocyte binding protein n=1 Tax=Histomonas meleagridis TaxID=135588 RepID=UPI00355A205F|nr:erythrocyte binding protein [Histomonas meleagridis]KAH0800950.1 erythrocyte binding protein [Histomonas meleagridis]